MPVLKLTALHSSYSSNRRPKQTKNTRSMFEFSQSFQNLLITFTFYWNFVPYIPNIHWLFGRPGLTKWKSWRAKDWILHRTQLNSGFAKSRLAARGPRSSLWPVGLPVLSPSPGFQQVFWPPLNQSASICIRYGLKNDGDEFEFVNHISHFNPLYLFVACCMLMLYAILITEPYSTS